MNDSYNGPRHANGIPREVRPGDDRGRNFASSPGQAPRPPAHSASSTGLSRAERFEDEKRRIVNSCFSKEIGPGQFEESYITHIRIQEDAAFPQSPPPLGSPPSNKKPRVIIVAVRNTGRVRLHKGRENSNGTFSIGKTWNMEELSCIQSYKHLNATTAEEIQQKQLAGDLGFVVTIGKPYYWQANSLKEKNYFIGSVVKIYRKYTQGKAPTLIGFSPQELDDFFGPSGPQSRNVTPNLRSSPAQAPPTPPERLNNRFSPNRLPSNYHRRTPSDYSSTIRPDQNSPHPLPPTPSTRDPRIPLPQSNGQRAPSSQYGGEPRPQSRERRRPEPATTASQNHLPTLDALTGGTSRERPLPEPGSSNGTTPPVTYQTTQRRVSSNAQAGTALFGTGNGSVGSSSIERGPTDISYSNDGVNGRRRDLSPRSARPGTGRSDNSSLTSKSEEPTPDRNRLAKTDRWPTHRSENVYNDNQRAEGSKPEHIDPPRLENTRYQQDRSRTRQVLSGSADRFPSRPKSPLSNDISPLDSRNGFPSGSRTHRSREDSSASKGKELESVVSPAPTEPEAQSEEEEIVKAGHGPMVSKRWLERNGVRNKFTKAITANNASRFISGGSGSKIINPGEETSSEANGISGVFLAPGRHRMLSDDSNVSSDESASKRLPVEDQKSKGLQLSLSRPGSSAEAVRTVAPTDSVVDRNEPTGSSQNAPLPTLPEPEPQLQRRRSYQQAKNLTAVGVDPLLLEGRCLDFEAVLGEFGWTSSLRQPQKVDTMEVELRRALGRVEAGSWLENVEHKDDRAEAVERMLDRAIAECEDLEGLLTLYSVELSSLNEDVAYIEAQSHGLQVQTANQKLLQSELHRLLETISINPKSLMPLRRASLASPEGLSNVESCLLQLYNSLVTIDPGIKRSQDMKADQNTALSEQASELSSMRAVQERKETFMGESIMFLDRLQQHMDGVFAQAFRSTKDAYGRRRSTSTFGSTNIDAGLYDLARSSLWMYGPLILFAKEVNLSSWSGLLQTYQQRAQKVYKEDMQDIPSLWKKAARKPTGEEQEVLFTWQDRDNEGKSSSTRKITVKRNPTFTRSRRLANGEKSSSVDKLQAEKLLPFEAFANSLEEITPLIFTEQNFITEFFHASSLNNVDFTDAIKESPESRKGPDLAQQRPFEPDRTSANRVYEAMGDIFGFWPTEAQNLITWAITFDPLQLVGIIATIERKLFSLEDSNQDFLTRSLQQMHERLVTQFSRFIDEQVHAIEDTKVKIKRRKGVTGFIKIFPNFSAMVESMLPSDDDVASVSDSISNSNSRNLSTKKLEVRTRIDEGYHRINKAMFESVKIIARESPAVAGASGGTNGSGGVAGAGGGTAAAAAALNTATGDPEDKAALNYHVLIIENMNHYLEEVDERGATVLKEWKAKAAAEMSEHLDLYLGAVIRRPLGKLLDFIESTESLLVASPNQPPSALASRSSHSRSVFKKILAAHDSRELRRGVDALKKRVEKHFGDADDSELSKGLVKKVLRQCEGKYVGVWERVRKVIEGVYEGSVELEWKREDVAAVFRK